MKDEDFQAMALDPGASWVFESIADQLGEKRAERAIGSLLEVGLPLKLLPLAFALSKRSAEWFTYNASRYTKGLVERTLDYREQFPS